METNESIGESKDLYKYENIVDLSFIEFINETLPENDRKTIMTAFNDFLEYENKIEEEKFDI